MKRIPLTQGKFALVDDEDFDWLNQWKWCAHKGGDTHYAKRGVVTNGKTNGIFMHRLILDAKKGQECDHRNGNGLDNRRTNLRIVTKSQNAQNRKMSKSNTSGFKGVYWSTRDKKWRAEIYINRKKIRLGYFVDIKCAALSYKRAAKKYHGEFARLN